MRTIVQSPVDGYIVLKALFEEHAKFTDNIIRFDEKSLLKELKNQLTRPISLDEVFDELISDGLIHLNPSNFSGQPQIVTISIKGASLFQKYKDDKYYISKVDEVKIIFNIKEAEQLLFENIDHNYDDIKVKTIRAELCSYFFGSFIYC